MIREQLTATPVAATLSRTNSAIKLSMPTLSAASVASATDPRLRLRTMLASRRSATVATTGSGGGAARAEEDAGAEAATWFTTRSGRSRLIRDSRDSVGSPIVIGVALWWRLRGGISPDVHPWGIYKQECLLFGTPKDMLFELLFTPSRPHPHKEIALGAVWFITRGRQGGGTKEVKLQPQLPQPRFTRRG